MILYLKSPFITVAEFHFDEDAPATGADIVRYLWRASPVSSSPTEASFTLVLDLAKSPQTLLANMHAETRYRIRRAEKDRFQYDFWCAGEPEASAQFCDFYDGFAASKHLVPANRKRLSALGERGVLDVSRVRDSTGIGLVWHAHYRAGDRARGIHSASLLGNATDPALRALIGRANCHHTWCDLLRFQQQGLALYDLGGWYGGTEDQEKLRINRFKESFGGVVIKEFNSETGVTTKGKLALGAKAVVLSASGWRRSWKLPPRPQKQTAAHLR